MTRLLKDVATVPTTKGVSDIRLTVAAILMAVGSLQIVAAVRSAARDTTGDLGRQWVVAQYVIRGVNPFPVALDALRAHYGILAPKGPVHLKDLRIYAIPNGGPNPQTDPMLGPPEATYSPPSVMMLLPLGLVPRNVVRFLWLLTNLALLFVVARELKLLTRAEEVSFFFFLGLVLVWPASSSCVEREQFSLLSLACILSARRLESTHAIAAGLLYSVSMVKPSLSIPFLLLPLLDRAILTLGSLAVSQLALLGAMSWAVHANPFRLIGDWLTIAAYFRQGMYTVQDVINSLRIDGSIWDILIQISILVCSAAIASRFGFLRKIAFLSVISCTWTYHSDYDFAVLLIPAVLFAVQPFDARWVLNFTALGIIGLGLTAPIYGGRSFVARGTREAVRFSLAALAIGIAWSEFQPRRSKTLNPA
jgi:hypothetical protein